MSSGRWLQSLHIACHCVALVLIAAGDLGTPALAGTVYWNATTAAPTSQIDVPVTVGDVTKHNFQGTSPMISTTSASTGYTFTLSGTSTSASGTDNFGAAARLGALDTGTSTYFEFTITPNPVGELFRLQSIGFGTRSTLTGPQAWTLRGSLDNYASDLVTPGVLSNNSVWTYVTAALLNELVSTTPTTLRLYGYNGAADDPSFQSPNWRIDDLQLAVVPEPGAVALGVPAALVLYGLRRYRRRGPA